ncbi:MAG: allantoate amidohydrolase [Actinomycetes bacterium]
MTETSPPGGDDPGAQARAEASGCATGLLEAHPEAVGMTLTADPARIGEHLSRFASLSEPGPGVTRLAYTRLEREAHEVFATHMRSLGLRVWVDAAGNTLAERDGDTDRLAALGTGSHLDSVPHGGRFDGIAGVVAAMEVARLFVEQPVVMHHPVRFVSFAAEEGARFGQACTGSRLAAGLCGIEDLTHKQDADGVSLAEAMRSVGIDPVRAASQAWDPGQWAAFLELHIEQGSVLQTQGEPIGVVDLVSGSTRLRLQVRGRASHTGGTPMHLRADALTGAAEIVLAAETLANDARHRGTRVTVGQLTVHPGSITTIPGDVEVYVDVRDVDSDRQRASAGEVVSRSRAICDRRGLSLDVDLLADASPVVLPIWLRQVVSGVCAHRGTRYRVMPSGASHDTQMINQIMPSGLIFVPSRDGLSHVPSEWTSAAQIATGTDVLAESLLALDADLAGQVPTRAARSQDRGR